VSRDIFDAFAHIRRAFVAANLNPPAAINLATHDDGMRLLGAAAQSSLAVYPGDPRLGTPIELADGSVFMECELFGMKVRWPANRRATPDGSWSFV
jgi:hypothetical protein